MERSLLSRGDQVAIYTATPVPTDPYNDWAAAVIQRAEVLDLPETGGVIVRHLDEHDQPIAYTDDHISSRAVIAPWRDYMERRLSRVDASTDQRRVDRLAREARALALAKERWPTATLRNGAIVVGAEEFLHAEERR